MAFNTTATPPTINSLVTIKFSGLMVLRPKEGANDICEICVHRHSREHSNQVILIVNKPNLPPTLVPLLGGALTADFEIRLNPDSAADFKIFQRDPFDRTLPNSHVNDIRWAINLRGPNPDARPNNGAKPVATLKMGVLYTSNLTNPPLDPVLTCPTGGPVSLKQFAGDLAAAIDPAGKTVLLKWKDMGDDKDVTLPRDFDPPNTSYTLYFINEPPNLASAPHDELPLYYKVLEKSNGAPIPPGEQCKLKFADETRSDEFPCMPILLNP
jgi:hypothetical protein